MASVAEIEADAQPRAPLPPQIRDAVARARARLTGLIVVAGATREALADRDMLHVGIVEDRPSMARAIDAAEHGLVIAEVADADAVAALVSLRRFAADRFAFAAALRLVIAGRSVPALCGNCREPVQAFGSSAALLGLDSGSILWTAPGCTACRGQGKAGDVPVFEAVEIDAAMRRLIYDGADAPLLARHAFLIAPNFAAAARAMAREGRVSPEDAVRISRG